MAAARARRAALVGGLLTGFLLAGVLAGCGSRPDPTGSPQGRPVAGVLTDRTRAVQGLLDARAAALLRRDRAGFLAAVDPTSGAHATQGALFDDLAAVPLASWTYAVDAAGWHRARAGWATRVLLAVALDGVDSAPATSDQVVTVVRRGDRWMLTGLAGSPAIWDEGPVVAVRGERSLVLGHTPTGLARLAAEADEAVRQVTAVWGSDWPQRAVLVVPADRAELGRLVRSGPVGALAAMTVAGRLADGTRGDDRVVVDPTELVRLDDVGRQVVLTHEVVHVATGSVTGPGTPTWLSEGLADHVGFLGTGLPVRAVAAELADDVRAGRVPTALPSGAAFGSADGLSAVYEQAFLAVELLVRTYGQDRVLALYREVGAGATLDQGLRALGTDLPAFTAAWRSDLVRQLS